MPSWCYALAKLEPFKDEVKELFGIELTTSPKVKYFTLDNTLTSLQSSLNLSHQKQKHIQHLMI